MLRFKDAPDSSPKNVLFDHFSDGLEVKWAQGCGEVLDVMRNSPQMPHSMWSLPELLDF